MKTNVKILALAASLLAAPFAHATTPGTVEPNEPTKAEAAATSFSVGSYRAANSNNLRVFVEKNNRSAVRVEIKNAQGEVLYERTISKQATDKSFKFDLNELPVGHYTMEVSNRQKKVVTAFNVKPAQPTAVAAR